MRNLWVDLEKENLEGTGDIVPGYCSLLVYYDSISVKSKELIENIERIAGKLSEIELPPPKVYHIPVFYGEEMGPDLNFVAEENNLEIEEVIDIHTSRE